MYVSLRFVRKEIAHQREGQIYALAGEDGHTRGRCWQAARRLPRTPVRRTPRSSRSARVQSGAQLHCQAARQRRGRKRDAVEWGGRRCVGKCAGSRVGRDEAGSIHRGQMAEHDQPFAVALLGAFRLSKRCLTEEAEL